MTSPFFRTGRQEHSGQPSPGYASANIDWAEFTGPGYLGGSTQNAASTVNPGSPNLVSWSPPYVAPGYTPTSPSDLVLFEELLQHLDPGDRPVIDEMFNAGHLTPNMEGPTEARQSKLSILIKAIALMKARKFRARNALDRAARLASLDATPGKPVSLKRQSLSPGPSTTSSGTQAIKERRLSAESDAEDASTEDGLPDDLGDVDEHEPPGTGESATMKARGPKVGLHLLAEIAIRAKRRVRLVRERAARERRASAIQTSRKSAQFKVEAVREHSDRLRQLFDVLDGLRQMLDRHWHGNPERFELMPPTVTDMVLRYRRLRDGLDMGRQDWRARLEAAMMMRAFAGWRRFTDQYNVPYPDMTGNMLESLQYLQSYGLDPVVDGKKVQSIRRGLTSRGMPDDVAAAFLEKLRGDLRFARDSGLLNWPVQSFVVNLENMLPMTLPPRSTPHSSALHAPVARAQSGGLSDD